ncbi:hypothetical protein JXL21_06365 [Candidatus Bathyarchaeota archaeon]|nr:hypothetical protein [Candidatus Bathyarchaeota archaeon]
MWRNAYRLTVMFLAATLLASAVVYKPSEIINEPSGVIEEKGAAALWRGEPEVRDKPRSNLWFRDRPGPINTGSPKAVADAITDRRLDDTHDIIDEVYVNLAIDTRHKAVYVSVSDISPETLDSFRELIGDPQDVYIYFMEAPAPLTLVEEWEQAIIDSLDELRERGVPLNMISVTVNGTIQMGMTDISPEVVDTLLDVLEGKVPPGILQIAKEGPGMLASESDKPEEAAYEGLIDQEDDPLHDWEADPSGPKVLSLDVIDPETAEYLGTYILANSSGGFYRFFAEDRSSNDPVWGYTGSKPVKITGAIAETKDRRGNTVKVLTVESIDFSEMGNWYLGVLSRRGFSLGPYTFYKDSRIMTPHSDLMISLKILDDGDRVIKEVPLASHEGYLYYIPICGTGQPIAMFRYNQTVRVYGLMMPVKETSGATMKALMVFDATQRSW